MNPLFHQSCSRFLVLSTLVLLVGLLNTGRVGGQQIAAPAEEKPSAESPAAPPPPSSRQDWITLFDGKSLNGWTRTKFGGEGDVYVENECLIMDFGASLTGITLDQEAANVNLPKQNYEIKLEAKRLGGTDFFCGLTFPVADSHCSLIVGGWGGALVGLSSLDGDDAANNETQLSMQLRQDTWYPIRLRVKPKQISVWIDGRRVIHQSIAGRRISTRPEVELSKPLGICTWQTQAALRKIRLRRIP